MSTKRLLTLAVAAIAAAWVVSAIGCGGQAPEVAPATTDDAAASAAEAESNRAAEMAAKEEDLARRESEVAMKEREQQLAVREAAVAAKEKSARNAAAPAPAAPAPAPKAAPTVVPAGTELTVALAAPITTKTAKVGDLVEARLQADVAVDGRVVAPAGALVRGTVTEVVSGSHKIGGTPTLGVTFDSLDLAGGGTVAISSVLVQQGKSDTAKDSAKIAGGAVAGAIIGHQIDDDKGKIIGAILGGAAGTAAAQKTGGEVVLPEGTILILRLDAPAEVP